MKTLMNTFLKGLVFLLPLVFTFGLLYWLFVSAEQLLAVPLRWVLPEGAYITGMGMISAFVLIMCLGVLVQAYLVKHLFRFVERVVSGIPLVKTLYSAAQDFMGLIAGDKDQSMKSVVAVTLDNNIRLIGFVTNDNITLIKGEELIAVYLPMSYQVGGYTALIPRSRCEPLDIPVQTAMQQVLTAHISGGRH